MGGTNRQFRKVFIGKSKISGKGIFARKDIKKNETIFSVRGKIIKSKYSSVGYESGHRWLAIDKKKWISPFKDNPWRNINHSCNPNAGLKGRTTVVAMRTIKKDEEITIDYSITEDDPYWRMKCSCGYRNCRKIIRSVRFLSLKLFRKYKPFIPKFLQKSYTISNLR